MPKKPKRMVVSTLGWLLLAVSVASAQSSPQSFSSFYSRFQAAVAQKDKATLQKMMSSQFDFLITPNVAPSTVFSALDDNDGQLWTNLQTAVQESSPVSQTYGNKPSQLLQCTPSEVIYNCFVVFQKNKSNRWVWRAFVMPQK